MNSFADEGEEGEEEKGAHDKYVLDFVFFCRQKPKLTFFYLLEIICRYINFIARSPAGLICHKRIHIRTIWQYEQGHGPKKKSICAQKKINRHKEVRNHKNNQIKL